MTKKRRKRHTPEQIVKKLRDADTMLNSGNSTYQYLYRAKDFPNDDLALATLLQVLPQNVQVVGIPLNSRLITGKEDPGNLGNFDFQVDYRHESNSDQQDQPIAEGDERVNFHFSGGPPFFTNAIAQEKFGTDSRDVGNSINVKTDGSVEGAEIQIPDSGFSVDTQKTLGSSAIQVNQWVRDRMKQLWTTNSTGFRSLDPEDVLLTGFSGKQVGPLQDFRFDLAFEFAVSIGVDYSSKEYDTGRVSFPIGKRIPGFRLIWAQYETIEDSTDSVFVPEAKGLYVAQCFETSNFANLGILT